MNLCAASQKNSVCHIQLKVDKKNQVAIVMLYYRMQWVTEMPTYSIEVHEKSLVGGLGNHLVIGTYIDGVLDAEYNGLSTMDGIPTTVGWPWEYDDTIKVYTGNQYYIGTVGTTYSTTAFSTSNLNEFTARVSAMNSARELINAQNLDYQLLSQNSNSAAETLLVAAGLSLDISDLSGRYTPGLSNALLDDVTLADLGNAANGGSLSTGLSLAYNTITSIGATLDSWATDLGISMTMGEVLSAQGRGGGLDLYGKLLSTGMSGPRAIAVMWELEQDLQELEDIKNEYDLGESFINSVATQAEQANQALLHAAGFISPLVVDLDGDGIETISTLDGEVFDFNDPSIIAHGWLSGDDGFIVLDKNNNGVIESNTELFGSDYLDGFSALAKYDENHDMIIDNQDSIFTSLKIWRDANENGKTEDGELLLFSNVGLSEISLNARISTEIDGGNWIALHSEGEGLDGVGFGLYDVYFRTLREDGKTTASISSRESKVILGTEGDDILKGNDSDQIFWGGAGNDEFIFGPSSGNDQIYDFELGIDLVHIDSYSREDLIVYQTNDGSVVEYGGDSLLLHNVFIENDYYDLFA